MDPGPWSVVLREARMMAFSYMGTGFYIGKSLDPLSQISFMLVSCKTNELAIFVQGLTVSHTIFHYCVTSLLLSITFRLLEVSDMSYSSLYPQKLP